MNIEHTTLDFSSFLKADQLTNNNVNIFYAEFDNVKPYLDVSMLSAEEQQRGQRFVTEQLRLKFRLSHYFKRIALAKFTESQPDTLSFFSDEYGKPFLIDQPDCQFNLSHTDSAVAVVVCHQAACGIDIEMPKAMNDRQGVAEYFMHPNEYIAWQEQRLSEDFFYKTWTKKEALTKAIGKGMSLNFKGIKLISPYQYENHSFHVHYVGQVGKNHMAFACEKGCKQVRVYRLL
ncbi:4'-phosphopantetheinyl transferase superfamily protein [Endozoicomonas sp. SM1973]|uniref:4'-phosphopantetheinyl transferase superfamily protein n=1 Tax=Spartinivicinus marinus TaxID=2994442 RepID=A0A853IGE9_9GAMM|nr:4'-phosphopantetheinyl transferase superfamily protein [Spartinivicinus marinus]MCX4027753.1 4'-phosphopantetheinyl transferase superfamily protein [Spartinivicinus marinus]NYZ68557.1 4'-phosphopantetheinyl transferase superfamily protein [Spartinivicinus marinus]